MTPDEIKARAGRRLFMSEHQRRVRRVQALADHIEEYAGWLKRAVEGVAPDDLKTSLDSANYAQTIATDAANLAALVGEIEALREVSFIIEGES